MGKVANREFWESSTYNSAAFRLYYNRLVELACCMFEWKNLPETIDERYLELTLFAYGKAIFFKDEALGYLGLNCTFNGYFNEYMIPEYRTAISANGYNNPSLNSSNSVIIFNNYLRTPCAPDIETYARRLYNIDRTIDVNINAQKTPILIACEEQQYLAMKNAYAKYEGNQPVIFSDKHLSPDSLRCLNTGAPYVADKLNSLKTTIYNEVLTYLGISNVNFEKRERLLTDEVSRSLGGTLASRHSRLEMRRKACNEINTMFGLNIECNYREDYRSLEASREFDSEGFAGEDGSEGDNPNE